MIPNITVTLISLTIINNITGIPMTPNIKPKIKALGHLLFEVESFTKPGKFYVVDLREETCTCPHFRYRGAKCKHIKAAEEAAKRIGSAIADKPSPTSTYGQDPFTKMDQILKGLKTATPNLFAEVKPHA